MYNILDSLLSWHRKMSAHELMNMLEIAGCGETRLLILVDKALIGDDDKSK